MLPRLTENYDINPIYKEAFEKTFEEFKEKCHKDFLYFLRLYNFTTKTTFMRYLVKSGMNEIPGIHFVKFFLGKNIPQNIHDVIDNFFYNYLFEYIELNNIMLFCKWYAKGDAYYILQSVFKIINNLPTINIENALKYLFFDTIATKTGKVSSIEKKFVYIRKYLYDGDRKNSKYLEVFKRLTG